MDELLSVGDRDARPILALRVAVGGHRRLEPDLRRSFESGMSGLMTDMVAALRSAKTALAPQALYADQQPILHVLSPLACGADRIAASAGVAAGARLTAILPMAPDAYVQTFLPESPLAEFQELDRWAAERGTRVVLEPPDAADERARRHAAYSEAGDFMLRHADILVVLWNGGAAGGQGGTAELVERAAQYGIPVIWFPAKTGAPPQLRRPGSGFVAMEPDALSDLVLATVSPSPSTAYFHGETANALRECDVRDRLLDRQRFFLTNRVKRNGIPIPFPYKSSGPFEPVPPWPVRVWDRAASLVRWRRHSPAQRQDSAGYPLDTPQTRFLFMHYQRAGQLAGLYARLHRNAYFLLYFLAGLALCIAMSALALKAWKLKLLGVNAAGIAAILELIVLFAIVGVRMVDERNDWRDRWLDYRLLAEMLRLADVMALAGRPMPLNQVESIGLDMPTRRWVSDSYIAIVRQAGVVPFQQTAGHVRRLRDYVADERLGRQVDYHAKTHESSEKRAEEYFELGEAYFVISILAVAMKLALMALKPANAPSAFEATEILFGLIAGVAPSLAYVLFAIRNQAELEIVSQRSRRMLLRLERLKSKFQTIPDYPTELPRLSRRILSLAKIMRHDAADWASIFDVKKPSA